MAYALGFFSADGNIIKSKRNTFFFSFYSADRDILLRIKNVMRSNHKLSERRSRTGKVYRFQIGSREMFNDLLLLGLTPNKSRRLKLPPIPKIFFGDFVRGYFDGDGNVWTGFINRHRKRPTRVLQAVFTSSSTDFLRELLYSLKNNGIGGGSVYYAKNKKYGRLMLSTLDALKLREIMYNRPHKLCLRRKKIVFESFIKYAAVV